MRFPSINMFDHEGPTVAILMKNITAGVFEHLNITLKFDTDKSIKYIEHILTGTAPKKYCVSLLACKDTEEYFTGTSGPLGAQRTPSWNILGSGIIRTGCALTGNWLMDKTSVKTLRNYCGSTWKNAYVESTAVPSRTIWSAFTEIYRKYSGLTYSITPITYVRFTI